MTSENRNTPFDQEREIDRALKMLGQTIAPPNLANRIRLNLEIATSSKTAHSHFPFWIPATCAVAAAVLLAALLPMHVTRTKQAPVTENASVASAHSEKPHLGLLQEQRFPVENSQHRELDVRIERRRYARRRHSDVRHTANLLNYPLTRQEKLLIQFVRTAKPTDLQILNPEYQAKIEAKEEAAFAAYIHSGDSDGGQETAAAAANDTATHD